MERLDELQTILDASGDKENPDAETIREIMEGVHNIAVVGISGNPAKAARWIPSYLVAKGYEVIPVNPNVERVLGKESRKSLLEVTEPVDMVLVFRPSGEAARVAEVAMARKERPVIWLQEGIRADEVAARARAEGIRMVQDLCTYKVHQALFPA